MVTHSSILAWRIPWIEEPGGLQSSRGRKESDTTEQLTHTHTKYKGKEMDVQLLNCEVTSEPIGNQELKMEPSRTPAKFVGILQAGILEWVAISFSRGSS